MQFIPRERWLMAAKQRKPLSDATNMNMQIVYEISNHTTVNIPFQKSLYFPKALSALLFP